MKMVLMGCGGGLRGKTGRGNRIGRRNRHDQNTSTINGTAQGQNRQRGVEDEAVQDVEELEWRGEKEGRERNKEGAKDGLNSAVHQHHQADFPS